MSEVTTEFNNAQTFDAQQLAEGVAAGEQQVPAIDVGADYEASKEFSVSEQETAAVPAPKFQVPEPQETALHTEPTGNPDDFRAMAQELRPEPASGTVTDELVQKALEKSQPA